MTTENDSDKYCTCPLMDKTISDTYCQGVKLLRTGFYVTEILTEVKEITSKEIPEIVEICGCCEHGFFHNN